MGSKVLHELLLMWLISVEIKYAMDVLCVKRNNVENALFKIHSLLWVTSRLGRNNIDGAQVKATRLISDHKNISIYSFSKMYKK